MAQPIQIPKTTSSPADPNAPSFLTSIPPEVRNAVYEVLFKRNKRVLLHNAKAYYPKCPQRSEFECEEDYLECLEMYDEIFEEHIQKGREFKHGFGRGLPVLLSCRQMYHESAGVLYGSSIFLISRTLHCHDHAVKDFLKHKKAYDQLEYTPLWLASLGSQVNLLHKVHIDVDAICSDDCDTLVCNFDMLPIMRFIWKHPGLANKLEFSQTGRELEGHTDPTTAREADKKSEQRTFILNNLLALLCTQDSLRLKRYVFSDRLLEYVWVPIFPERRFACDVIVQFCNIPQPERHHIVGSGRKLTATVSAPDLGIQCLRYHSLLLEKIFEYASHSPSGIIFDLTQRTITGLNVSLLHLDSMLRTNYDVAGTLARANDVTIKVQSTSIESDFDYFFGLEELQFTTQLDRILFAERGGSSPLTVELAFEIPVNTSLYELKINIQVLIELFSQIPNPVLHVSLSCPRGQHLSNEAVTVDIVRLCLNTYLLLSDLFAKWSIPLSHKMNAGVRKLMIDGRGIVKSATCCSSESLDEFTLENEYAHLSKEEMYYFGYKMAASHQRDFLQMRKMELEPLDNRLFDIILNIRDVYWADWETVRPLPMIP